MPKVESIGLKGELFIEVRDKKTDKIKKVIKSKNAVLYSAAAKILNLFASGGTFPATQYLYLYDDTQTLIKQLTGSWGAESGADGGIYREFSAEDTSNDSYTVAYLGLSDQSSDPGYDNNNFAYKPSTAITKGASDTLTIKWRITVSYSSAPA